MKIACIVLTVDRTPRHNYLSTTLAHLRSSGLTDDARFTLDIFHSGSNITNLDKALIADCKATLHQNEQQLPFNQAFSASLAIAAAREPDYVLFFEDDVQVAQDFPSFVCAQLQCVLNAPMVDFATYYQEIKDAYLAGERIIELTAKQFYGTQCFAMTKHYAESYSSYVRRNQASKAGYADTWIDDWLVELKLERLVASSVPSAAQHIGTDSNFNHTYMAAQAFKDDVEKLIPTPTNKYVVWEKSNNEFVLRHHNTHEILDLNLAAQLIYLYCDGANTLADIGREIGSFAKTDRVELDQQIRQCLASLVERGAMIYRTA